MNYLSAQQVADRMSISIRTIRNYLKSGKLPSHKIGRLRRIAECDLDDFVTGRKHRLDMAAADNRMRTELVADAAQHMAEWESKRKKLWLEKHQATNPVLSCKR